MGLQDDLCVGLFVMRRKDYKRIDSKQADQLGNWEESGVHFGEEIRQPCSSKS